VIGCGERLRLRLLTDRFGGCRFVSGLAFRRAAFRRRLRLWRARRVPAPARYDALRLFAVTRRARGGGEAAAGTRRWEKKQKCNPNPKRKRQPPSLILLSMPTALRSRRFRVAIELLGSFLAGTGRFAIS